jgi:NAD(P)-dependent dehydrogenase (short-subunit alcohol dehydrogenase family)
MILVAGPTSTIGRELVDDLLDRDAPLCLVVRDPSRLAPEVRARVEVIEGRPIGFSAPPGLLATSGANSAPDSGQSRVGGAYRGGGEPRTTSFSSS